MIQYIGEYQCAVDNKGRMRLPTNLKLKIGEAPLHFVMKRGFEGCIELWPRANWDEKAESLTTQADHFNAEERQFVRRYMSGLAEVETDGADRLLIPKPLLAFAEIGEDGATIQGVGEKFELWSKKKYDEVVLGLPPEDFSEMASRFSQKAMKRATKPTFSVNVVENAAE